MRQNSDRRQRLFSGSGDYFASRFETRAVTRANPCGFSRIPRDKAAKVRADRRWFADVVLIVEISSSNTSSDDNDVDVYVPLSPWELLSRCVVDPKRNVLHLSLFAAHIDSSRAQTLVLSVKTQCGAPISTPWRSVKTTKETRAHRAGCD